MKFPSGTTDHPINKSGKRKILVSVWDFGAVHPQSERSHYVCNDHPAKMRPSLARAILKLYGESPVLDPMAGIGTTLVEAMLLGIDAVGIEYEKRFVEQANKNIENIRTLFSNRKLGKAVCVQGDARKLGLALKKKKAKSILFSPPCWKAMKCRASSKEKAMEKYLSSVKRARKVGGRPISKALAISSMGYSTSKENIGNVARFGSIVFSPPYFDALSVNKGGGSKASILYETTQDLQMKRSGPFAVKKNLPTPYSSKKGNIGNISKFGSIIFSPPYVEQFKSCSKERGKKRIKKFMREHPGKARSLKRIGTWWNINLIENYSKDPNNIGNLKYNKNIGCKSYLSEMFKVYRECYRVLKPGKFMIVVVKDIQRNWKTVPLGADTIKLCQLAGFDCHDVLINKMYFPSFWMLRLAKKSQTDGTKGTQKFHALKSHEYILVFRKASVK